MRESGHKYIIYINYNILYYQYVFNPTQCIHDYVPQELCFENEGNRPVPWFTSRGDNDPNALGGIVSRKVLKRLSDGMAWGVEG